METANGDVFAIGIEGIKIAGGKWIDLMRLVSGSKCAIYLVEVLGIGKDVNGAYRIDIMVSLRAPRRPAAPPPRAGGGERYELFFSATLTVAAWARVAGFLSKFCSFPSI
ncbi:hypothetical protein Ahy_B07g088960 isoform H [Arachis hypogaea]|uniref:Uncharacterized protein n=1 Tax=Arachis hypogaea TaxID=3818 RepID=A0A444YFZ6_ARAHY|nr:hypothetical protein Ahy_B07g088960 isoform H [Arachis hypogaea]